MAKYIIYKIDDPTQLVMSWDSSYNVSLTTSENLAAEFASQTAADAMIQNFEGSTFFWGSRPKRP